MAGLESVVRGSSLKWKTPRWSSSGVSQRHPYCHNFEAEQAGALKLLCSVAIWHLALLLPCLFEGVKVEIDNSDGRG